MCLLKIDFYITELPLLGRDAFIERGVYIGEFSVLEGCLYWRYVCIREMSVLEKCLY